MNWSTTTSGLLHGTSNKKFKGVRRRKWGKWVSEIRVPGTQERLWLGTYATPEAAAVAHDVAVYCLRRPSTLEKLNFPETLSSYRVQQREMMSPRSVQKVASDVAMDVDARNIAGKTTETETHHHVSENKTDDYDHAHSNSNAGPAADDSDVFLWEGLGDEYNLSCSENEASLSISVEDYL